MIIKVLKIVWTICITISVTKVGCSSQADYWLNGTEEWCQLTSSFWKIGTMKEDGIIFKL